MRSRLRALATAAALGAALVVTAPGPAAADVAGPVVLLGTGGVRWADVGPATPALRGLLDQGSTGWLAVRSVRDTTCPVDGWLAVSAGRRAADSEPDPGTSRCREPQPVSSAPGSATSLPAWPTYLAEAAAGTFDARPGMLGEALAGAGKTSAAVGPGAAIALADSRGQVPSAWPGRVDGAAGTVPPAGLVADVQAALQTDPDLLVVDLGVVRDPAGQAAGDPPLTGAYARGVAEQVAALDTRLGLVLAELPAGATVLVGSLADAGATSQLQLLAARGPAPLGGQYADSLLGSESTRQDGFAQATDLLPTVLTALSVPVPAEAVGSALKPVQTGRSAAERRQTLDDLAAASTLVTPIVPWIFRGFVLAQILVYAAAVLMLRRKPAENADSEMSFKNARTLRGLRRAAVVFGTFPAATFLANLVPWWRSEAPGLTVAGVVVLCMLPVSALALLGPWRNALLGPMGVVGGCTALVLAVDAAAGSKLALSSLMGVQPTIAGRFYGFSNPVFALFATGALLAAIAIADHLVRRGLRWQAGAAVLAIGIVATVIDGAPDLGSDFGGPPAIIPAFAVLALLVTGLRVTWSRAVLIALVTAAALVAIGWLDWLRPAGDRTHLGRFVQTLLDGEAAAVIQRKADQNLEILFGSWLSALLPFAVVFVVLVLARPVSWGVRPLQLAYDRSPVLRSGLIAFGLLLLLGTLLNDSGAVVPAVAGTMTLPLLIATSVRALELQDGPAPATPAAAGAPPTPPPPPPRPAPATARPPGGTRA